MYVILYIFRLPCLSRKKIKKEERAQQQRNTHNDDGRTYIYIYIKNNKKIVTLKQNDNLFLMNHVEAPHQDQR